MKKPLIVLTGPTAAGKSGLSIQLAKKINGSIISADSVQVYKHMDIGSAKITEEEMCGIRHYLIDVLEPYESFDVVRFVQMAKEAIEDVYLKNRIPIVVGGTGFYIQALLKDVDFEEEDDHSEYRNTLYELYESKGASFLHDELKNTDPVSAASIHENNIKRVIRALEFYHFNGYPISSHNDMQKDKESVFDHMYFVLYRQRQLLYESINKRVDEMIDKGLIEEVRRLKDVYHVKKEDTAFKAIGYKQMYPYLEGQYTLDKAIELIKRDTRHFAKRQMTWFKREKNVIIIDKDEYASQDEILDFILEKSSEILRIN